MPVLNIPDTKIPTVKPTSRFVIVVVLEYSETRVTSPYVPAKMKEPKIPKTKTAMDNPLHNPLYFENIISSSLFVLLMVSHFTLAYKTIVAIYGRCE